MKAVKQIPLLTLCIAVSACSGMMQRVEEIGSGPQLSKEKSPVMHKNYEPVQNWPTPVEPVMAQTSPNSLWQPGARSFFKDQRATRVGDILTVVIKISDKADLNNQTQNSRNNSENVGKPTLYGFEESILGILPGDQDADMTTPLLGFGSTSQVNGSGKIGRKESIESKVAATITQVLPNGNLVLRGVQQIRVNHELREMLIEGVIRPEDIASDNTIQSEQIAEARISYGGRGIISDAQQPRYGQQLFDVISPF